MIIILATNVQKKREKNKKKQFFFFRVPSKFALKHKVTKKMKAKQFPKNAWRIKNKFVTLPSKMLKTIFTAR
jgi:hypothetical protein